MTTNAPQQRRRAGRHLTVLLAAVVVLPACTAQVPDRPAASGSQAASGARASQSQAAELQAGLTHAFVQRVHVIAATGAAVEVGGGRLDLPAVQAWLAALDGSSRSFATLLAAADGQARPELLLVLRTSDGLHVKRAVARSTGDAAAAASARTGLEQTQRDLAATLHRLVPSLRPEPVAAALLAGLAAQLAVDVAEPYADLRDAVGSARAAARLLAGGIAAQRGLGDPGGRASTLRTDLTALLTEHVLLAGGLARELSSGGAVDSARTTLEADAGELADLLGGAYPTLGEAFLPMWRAHVNRLADYAVAVAAGGDPAQAGLRTLPESLTRLLASHVSGLPVERARDELVMVLDSLVRAVDAAASSSSTAPAELLQASADAPALAALLAAAVAEHLRLT